MPVRVCSVSPATEEALPQKHLQDPLTPYSTRETTYIFHLHTVLNIITRYIERSRKTPSLPKPLKTLLLSLAVSDVGVGVLVQPTYVAVLVMKIEQNADNSAYYTIFDEFYVQRNLFSFASFLSVFALTVDRLSAIHLHLRYQELVTHKSVVVVVSSVWVLSTFIALLGLTEMDTDSGLYLNPIAIIGRIVEH